MNFSKDFENGVYTVLITPFTEDNHIDYTSYFNLIDKQIECKSSSLKGLILLGTTSESPTLVINEKEELVKMTYQYIREKSKSLKIIVGVGGNNTIQTLEFAKYCSKFCDGFMVTVPHYNKPTQEGILQHFVTICGNDEISSKPIIMYNIPSRCGVNMEPETIKSICERCENVCAIKEASGSIEQTIKIINTCDIRVFSGDDALAVPLMSVGAVGVISIASNVYPDHICSMITDCLSNNFTSAREKYYKMYNFIKALFIETNPIPIKYALQKKGLIVTDNVRLPLISMSNGDHIKTLMYYMSDIDLNYKINNYNELENRNVYNHL